MKCAKDCYNDVASVYVLAAQNVSSATTTKTKLINTTGVQGVRFIAICSAYAGGTGATWKLVEGDTSVDTNLTDVASTDYTATSLTLCTDGNTDETVNVITYRGSKKYVGANITTTSSTSACYLGVLAETFFHESAPVTAQTATART